MARAGGRYVVDGSGEKQLVERTDWTPPATPKPKATKKQAAPEPNEPEVNDDVLP